MLFCEAIPDHIQIGFGLCNRHIRFEPSQHIEPAKAAVGALPILIDGGTLVQIANSSDGIGAPEYVHELELLRSLPSHRDYIAALYQRPVVQKDQWEVEMWCKVLEKVGGPGGLIYCTTGISPGDLEKLPLTSSQDSVVEWVKNLRQPAMIGHESERRHRQA